MCRTGKVFDEQTGNNGVDKVRAIRRKGLDDTKGLITR